jgi:hypothetical protein
MPAFNRKENVFIILTVITLAVIGFFLNQHFQMIPSELFAIVFSNYVATGLGAFIGLYATCKMGMRHFAGKGIFLLGMTSLFSLVGYLLWDYYDFVLGEELPYPSLGDVSWAFSIFCAIAGVLFLVRIYQPQIKIRMIVEGLLVFIGMTALTTYLIGWPDLSESTFSSGFFDIFYTLTGALWVSIAFITLRIAGGKIFLGLFVYTLSMILMVIGDTVFAIRVANETFYYGDIADIILLCAWLIGAAGIYLTAQTLTSGGAQQQVETSSPVYK